MHQGITAMDHAIVTRAAANLAREAQLCRMLAAQLSLESEARALLSQAMRLEAAIAAAGKALHQDAAGRTEFAGA